MSSENERLLMSACDWDGGCGTAGRITLLMSSDDGTGMTEVRTGTTDCSIRRGVVAPSTRLAASAFPKDVCRRSFERGSLKNVPSGICPVPLQFRQIPLPPHTRQRMVAAPLQVGHSMRTVPNPLQVG